MPNKELTELVFILDRSGSMAGRVTDVIGGYNRMIADQKEQPGDANITLTVFDDLYDRVFTSVPLRSVQQLTTSTYFARGNTALHDAIGKTINDVGHRLARQLEHTRPGKVIVVIFTDGFENSSHEFNAYNIKSMIEHQRSKYNWDFTFIGANQDAVLTAQAIGIPAAAAITFTAGPLGVNNVMRAASAYASSSRSGLNASYSMSDRVDAVADDQAPLVGTIGTSIGVPASTLSTPDKSA